MYPYYNDTPIVYIQVSPVYNHTIKFLKIALVDSGASLSAITPSLIKEMKLKSVTTKKIRTLGGIQDFEIYVVNIEFHGITFPKVHVFGLRQNIGQGPDGTQVLGRDILNKLHICLDGNKRELEVL